MADPYIGEIRMFGGNFAPVNWMFCEGQTIAISEYETLFNLIGTTYGGDGQSTFSLPDFRGRIPLHQFQRPGGSNFTLAQAGGSETVLLTTPQIPMHTHAVGVTSSPGHVADPSGAHFAAHRDFPAFDNTNPGVSLAPDAVSSPGGNQPHENMPPFLCVSFIICMFGIYPPQS